VSSQVRDRRNISYLCLQALHEGQASYAHVNGIVDGLRALGWRVRLFAPGSTTKPQAMHRLVAIVRTQIECLRHMSEIDVLYVRWHFAAWPTVAMAKLRKVPFVAASEAPRGRAARSEPGTARMGERSHRRDRRARVVGGSAMPCRQEDDGRAQRRGQRSLRTPTRFPCDRRGVRRLRRCPRAVARRDRDDRRHQTSTLARGRCARGRR
jgi:hypothetical protein